MHFFHASTSSHQKKVFSKSSVRKPSALLSAVGFSCPPATLVPWLSLVPLLEAMAEHEHYVRTCRQRCLNPGDPFQGEPPVAVGNDAAGQYCLPDPPDFLFAHLGALVELRV